MGGSFQFWLWEAVMDNTTIDDQWLELTEVAFQRDRDTILVQLQQMRETIKRWDETTPTAAQEAARKEAP